MNILIVIPDAFKDSNEPMVQITGRGFEYATLNKEYHGIQIDGNIDKDILLPHLDKIADEIREMIKEKLI